MRQLKYGLLSFLLLGFWAACEQEIEHPIPFSGKRHLVAESVITNEYRRHELNLHYSVNALNELPEAVSGAEVFIFEGYNTLTFSEAENSPGKYLTDSAFIAVINRVYRMQIRIDGDIYEAACRMLPVNDFEPVGWETIGTDSCRLTNLPPQYSPVENAMHEIRIDWSHLPIYADSVKTSAIMYRYTLSSLDIPQLFAPDAEQIIFPPGAIITQRKYSLSPEHAEFMRSVLLETEWRGGLFDTEQGQVITNFSEGALGFFGACSVIEKQVTVD